MTYNISMTQAADYMLCQDDGPRVHRVILDVSLSYLM